MRPIRAVALPEPSTIPPSSSSNTFTVEGYGSSVIRRLLKEKLGWREREASDTLPHLHWNGSAAARKFFREVVPAWQLVNHFPRSGMLGSKSGLLWNLRETCSSPTSSVELQNFFPRSYDLRSAKELRGFLLDFVVTRCEALLRRPEVLQLQAPEQAQGVHVACQLLTRLAAAQVKESQLLQRGGHGPSEGETRDGNWGFTLSPAEWSFLTGKLGAEYPPSPALQQDGALGLLVLEARWMLQWLAERRERQFSLNGDHAFWLLKEPSANCGRGIHVFSDLLPLLEEAQNGGWVYVVQKYMERPLLVGPELRKCDVRLWVLVTSWNPAVIWAWPEPYLRLASKPFSWDTSKASDPFVHLTNRAVQKAKVGSTPKEGLLTEDEDHIWQLAHFLNWGDQHLTLPPEQGTARTCWNSHTWPRMLEAVRTCIKSCRNDVGGHPPGCFELFGFDFLLDAEMRPWLLEANSSPDLCEDAGPTLRGLAETALTELLQLVSGLQGGRVSLPTGLASPIRDESIPGSGHWHLILREEVAPSHKELQLRRTLKGARRPCPFLQASPSPTGHRMKSGRSQHSEMLRMLLGEHLPSRLLPRQEQEASPLKGKEFVLAGDRSLLEYPTFPVQSSGLLGKKLNVVRSGSPRLGIARRKPSFLAFAPTAPPSPSRLPQTQPSRRVDVRSTGVSGSPSRRPRCLSTPRALSHDRTAVTVARQFTWKALSLRSGSVSPRGR